MELKSTNNVVEFVRLERMDAPPPGGELQIRSKLNPLHRWLRQRRTWLAVVILPTLLAAIYFEFIAADRYEVESRFVVRSPSAAASSQIANLVQGSTIVRSGDDAYIATAYIASRDAVRMLVRDAQLLERLNRPEADLFWRYPGLLFAHNDERLWRHFQSFYSIEYDETTGISTLMVQAFRADDAKAIAEHLLDGAENLINRLSDRAQRQAIADAKVEVETSRQRATAALERVTEFRKRTSIIDPGRVSTAALEIISRLALEQTQLRAQAAEIRKASPQSPQLDSLQVRISALDEQILREHKMLAGNDQSLAPLMAEYERLMLERGFAETTFNSAVLQLEAARLEAERQRLFLERISTPTPPDYAKYPMRALDILLVFIVALMLHAVGTRLVADTRSHAGR